ncbi:hypothetical protein [Salipiger thiooxidans]|uniref:hypothetical protein n=1 Tax=Salipiger thiooxidans TaxID=282683 RepID=UPI001CD58F06|nr:hypothetical protein [Salipiger thiooxidans]MCA0850719.1 hypothetical protein [Salipiger thiooxidans]
MTAFSSYDTFRPIGQIVATDVMPALARPRKLPLRISCLGTASHDDGEAADSFDRTIPLGECPSPDEAVRFASLRLSQASICTGPDSFTHFRPRIMVIQDREHRLFLAGYIRAGVILWQQPVASDSEARRVVTEASRLRGMAFRASDPAEARTLRYRAAMLEARLVDPFWRATAAELLRLPRAA